MGLKGFVESNMEWVEGIAEQTVSQRAELLAELEQRVGYLREHVKDPSYVSKKTTLSEDEIDIVNMYVKRMVRERCVLLTAKNIATHVGFPNEKHAESLIANLLEKEILTLVPYGSKSMYTLNVEGLAKHEAEHVKAAPERSVKHTTIIGIDADTGFTLVPEDPWFQQF